VGAYAGNVTVSNGVIQITYSGSQVNPSLYGQILTLVPYTNDNNDIVWQCGLAPAPAGNIASGAVPGGTTLPQQMLPAACHS
jgi:hypothetical protein